jgi:hypothetical protein
MLPSGMAWVCRVSARTTVGDLAHAVRVDVAEHGVVVVLRPRSQARQLRQLRAALRAAGYQARYFLDGTAQRLLVVTGPGQEMPRCTAWWGG